MPGIHAPVGDMSTGIKTTGGEGGIRTLDRVVRPYNGLANRRLQPLGHLSGVLKPNTCGTNLFGAIANLLQRDYFWSMAHGTIIEASGVFYLRYSTGTTLSAAGKPRPVQNTHKLCVKDD